MKNPFTPSPLHPFTPSSCHLVTRSPAHPLTRSPVHPFTLSHGVEVAMTRAPQELAAQLQGLLSFPVTPFNAENEIDLPRFREHIQYMAGRRPDGLFVCGGTGEFYSLGLDEYRALVRAAVEEAGGRLPIVAGVGDGTRLAIEFARAAEEARAAGPIVMPPYLLLADPE